MKAKYIKRREQFEREAGALLKALGAVDDPQRENDPWPCYILETQAGKLSLSIHTDRWCCEKPWFSGTGSPWVAGRFQNVKAAHKLTGGESNPYSGKFNQHLWNGWTENFTPGLFLLEHALLSLQQQRKSIPQEL